MLLEGSSDVMVTEEEHLDECVPAPPPLLPPETLHEPSLVPDEPVVPALVGALLPSVTLEASITQSVDEEVVEEDWAISILVVLAHLGRHNAPARIGLSELNLIIIIEKKRDSEICLYLWDRNPCNET